MNTDGTRARGIIAVIVVTALVMLTIVLAFFPPPPASEKLLLIVVGALIAFNADVKQFYFGSSSGSKVMVQNQQEITKAAVAAVASSVPAPAAQPLVQPPSGQPGDPVSVKVEPEDPKLTEYRKSMLAIDKNLSEEAIVASWKSLQSTKPDVSLP